MENYQTINTERDGAVLTLWLARPEVHNALNDIMIREITSLFNHLEQDEEISVVVVRGAGKSFCSGADLRWMQNAFSLSPPENLKECRELSGMFGAIFNSNKIVIAVVHGNVFGGGTGLAAVCDLAYCTTESTFSLSEARLGLAAASITPYLLNKVRPADLKELIFTAKHFHGKEAVHCGLISQHFPSMEELEINLKQTTSQILSNGKRALNASKKLINNLSGSATSSVMESIPSLLAKIRVSEEAREGFSAFLEKRKPNW
jgi:methylglutaconyl-CoA hydratase